MVGGVNVTGGVGAVGVGSMISNWSANVPLPVRTNWARIRSEFTVNLMKPLPGFRFDPIIVAK